MKTTEKDCKTLQQINREIKRGIVKDAESFNGACRAYSEGAFRVAASYFKSWGFETAQDLHKHCKGYAWTFFASKDGAALLNEKAVPTIWKQPHEAALLGLEPCDGGTIEKMQVVTLPEKKQITERVQRRGKDGALLFGKNGAPLWEYKTREITERVPHNVLVKAYKRAAFKVDDIADAFNAWTQEQTKECKDAHNIINKFLRYAKRDDAQQSAKALYKQTCKELREKLEQAESKTQAAAPQDAPQDAPQIAAANREQAAAADKARKAAAIDKAAEMQEQAAKRGLKRAKDKVTQAKTRRAKTKQAAQDAQDATK